jgi:hypothetical protein
MVSLEMLKEGEVLSFIDFTKNYFSKHQDEIQKHWFNFQLSILVHIIYQVNPAWDPLDLNSLQLITKYHYYLLNDRKHDNQFVQHAFSLHWVT